MIGEQTVRLKLLASQAHDQRRRSEIGVCTNMPKCADRNLRAWSFKRDSASISVRNRNGVVHIWESRKQFAFDSPNSVVDCRRDTLHRRGDAQDVLGSNAAIRITKALEALPCEWRLRSRCRCSERQIVQRRRRRHFQELFPNPRSSFNRALSESNRLPVTNHRCAGIDRLQRDFVCLRNALAQCKAAQELRAGPKSVRVDNNPNVIHLMHSEVRRRRSLNAHREHILQRSAQAETQHDESLVFVKTGVLSHHTNLFLLTYIAGTRKGTRSGYNRRSSRSLRSVHRHGHYEYPCLAYVRRSDYRQNKRKDRNPRRYMRRWTRNSKRLGRADQESMPRG